VWNFTLTYCSLVSRRRSFTKIAIALEVIDRRALTLGAVGAVALHVPLAPFRSDPWITMATGVDVVDKRAHDRWSGAMFAAVLGLVCWGVER
jgi:hypothetical protein